MSYVDNNLKKADKFYKLKEFDKANDFYNLILSKFPKNQRALKGINLIKNLKSNSNSYSDNELYYLKELLSLYDQQKYIEIIEKLDYFISKVTLKKHFIYNLVGVIYFKMGRILKAITNLKRSIRLHPENHEAYFNLGNVLAGKNKLSLAIKMYKKATCIKPNYDKACNNLGIALKKDGQLIESINVLKKTIKINPEYFSPYNNLGKIYFEIGNYKNSINNFKKCIEIYTNSYLDLLHLNLNNNLQRYPLLSEMLTNLSISELANGDFIKGWKNYRARHKYYNPLKIRENTLIKTEQGLGDQVLFSRFLRGLDFKNNNYYFPVDEKLKKIFSTSFPLIKFISHDEKPNVESSFYLGDLAENFIKKHQDLTIWNRKYLNVCDNTTEIYRQRHSKNKIKCGISWLSKSTNENSSKDYYTELKNNMSINLLELKEILELSNIEFIDLQYTNTKKEREYLSKNFNINVKKYDDIDNFNDIHKLSCLIQSCDIILTIPNITAHLAGSLGKKTYLILPDQNGVFWYWKVYDDKFIWYDTFNRFNKNEFINKYAI